MIVATAGHVDHGKTSLVKALTGVDTDRLPEEKRRGMTIDLGFAYMPAIGFIDVPGHERFIHNMLAGVAGVDFALLVVAADDGVMPQTVEHLAILDLLGIANGAVALTKIDRAPPERIEEVRAEIESLLAPTPLSGSRIFPLSSLSGEGIDALQAHLRSAAAHHRQRAAEGNFRLCIDRAFNIAGAGLVVTGTAMSGEIAVGDSVRLLLAGTAARVRGIHSQNAVAQRGRAGKRCALNLAGMDGKTPIGRGDWVMAGEGAPAVRKLDVRLRSLGEPLKHWTPVHVHIGAADVLGRIALLGDDGLAQLVLERPVGAVHGDAFVVRDQSARRTLGGGRVIDVFTPVRGRARPERLRQLAAMEREDAAEALQALLQVHPAGLQLQRFAHNRNLSPDAAERLYASVPMKRAGAFGFSAERWRALRESVLAAVRQEHVSGLPREVADAVTAELLGEQLLVRDGAALRLPGQRPQLDPIDAALWERCRSLLERAAMRPPGVAELAAQLSQDPRKLEAALARFERHALVVRLSKTRFILPEPLHRLRELAEEEAKASGAITAASFRDRSGIGRNVAIEVLEYFDRIKFTRRAGDRHIFLGRESHPGGAPGLQIQ